MHRGPLVVMGLSIDPLREIPLPGTMTKPALIMPQWGEILRVELMCPEFVVESTGVGQCEFSNNQRLTSCQQVADACLRTKLWCNGLDML